MTAIKKKTIKRILAAILLLIITAGFIGYKMYTKPHRNVEEAKGINVTALQLATAYETNEPEANTLYLDKVLEVKGEAAEISKNQKEETVITLKGTDMGGVICTLEGATAAVVKSGAVVTVKGICTGYLTDVVLVRCKVEIK